MTTRIISRGFADEILACMARRGLALTPDLEALAQPAAGLDHMSVDQLAKLWQAVAIKVDDEFLGRSVRPMPVGSFKLLCHCVLNAGTLKKAIPRILHFLHILSGNLSATMSIENGTARVLLTDSEQPAQAFAQRMYWILIHGLSCWLVGRRIPLQQVDFACAMPARDADYRMFFGAIVRFEQRESCLAFDESYLRLPIKRSEASLKLFLQNAPGNILVGYRQESDLTTQLADRLRRQPPINWPKFQAIAGQLRLSTASLRRYLAHEGKTFQGIKDEIRMRLAVEWLTDRSLSVEEVASRLGFSDPGAFYRAFRKWTGETPGGYRRQQLGPC